MLLTTVKVISALTVLFMIMLDNTNNEKEDGDN